MFALASAAIIIVPGPTVTIIVANSLRSGVAAGLWNVFGTQVGLALKLVVLAAGFSTIVEQLGALFDVIRLLGAAYLVWLGVRLWRSDGTLGVAEPASDQREVWYRYAWQGFLVIWSNPKSLFFLGAFLPQFVDSTQPTVPQVALLGLIFMVVGLVFDGAYAVLAGNAGRWMQQTRVRVLERVSGSFLMGGGAWLALQGRSA